MSEFDPTISRRFARFSRLAGAVVAVFGGLVLLGWILDVASLKSFYPENPSMKANAAIGFLLLGIALRLHHEMEEHPHFRRIVDAMGAVVATVGGLTLLQYVTGMDFRIDELLFRDTSAGSIRHPGRMAPNTSVILILQSFALLLVGRRRFPTAGQVLASLSFLIALLAVLGYLYDVNVLTGPEYFTQIALRTSLAAFLLGLGILFATPDVGLAGIMSAKTTGGIMVRRLLPAAVIIPSILGWLRLLGQRAEFYQVDFGVALFAVASIIIFAVIIWWNGHSLHRISLARRQAEDESRQFKFISDNAGDAHLLVTRSGMIRYANKLACRDFGYTIEELTSMSAMDLSAVPELTAGRLEDLMKLPDFAVIDPYEVTIRRKDGTVFPASISVSRVSFDGEAYLYAVIRDISGLKKVQEVLEQRNKALETINRVNTTLAAELDLAKLVQTVTDAGTELTRAEYGAFFYNVISDEGEAYMLYSLSGAPAEAFGKFPMPRKTELFRATFDGEGIVRIDDVTRDPRYGRSSPYYGMPAGHLPVRSYLSAPVISRTGEVIGGLFFGHSAAEQFDEQSETLLQGIADQAAIAIENARLFTAAQSEIVERENAERRLKELNETLEQRVTERTVELKRANAQLTEEIAERTRAERELERSNKALTVSNRELQDFAYAASHDLQEPLRKISSFADLLSSEYGEALDQDGRFYLDRMRDAALRMSRLIQGLLAFSRIKTRGQPFEDLDLREVLKDVIEDLQVTIQESGGRVEIGDLPCIRADRLQMHQLFQNLIGNALKFRRSGVSPVVQIEAELQGTDESDRRCRITVADNGIGFDKKYTDRIFSPFQRLHGQSDYPGTGIGLAICRRIAERHHGTIWAQGQPGEGATFIVALPMTPDDPPLQSEA